MKSFRKYMAEVFSSPYDIHYSENTRNYITLSAVTDDDRDINLDAITLYQLGKSKNMNAWDISFDVDGSISVSGGGDAYRIFATIMEMIKMFVKEKNPEHMEFTAFKNYNKSRVKLYTTMLKKFAGRNGFVFRIDNTHPLEDKFILERK